MSMTIRAAVALQAGCRLYYDCPLQGGDYKSQLFFDKHRGQYATFVRHGEELVDVLDFKGRVPGRYLDPKGIFVQFAGEDPIEINVLHFVVADASKASLVDSAAFNERLGDLPHPVLFYPDDIVRFKRKPADRLTDDVRRVQQVFLGKPFTMNNIPRYEVMETEAEAEERIRKFHEENEKRREEDRLWSSPDGVQGWNTAGEDIELVSRSNVWALYNDSTKLAFSSQEDEAAFWGRDGICGYVGNEVKKRVLSIPQQVLNRTHGLSLENAYQLVVAGEADVIQPTFSNPSEGSRYSAKRVYDCFAQHRDHVRALTDQLWAHQVKQLSA